jgi:hypothetical protein
MSKVLYEVRNGTHVQWSLDKYDLSLFTEGKVIPQLQGVKAKKLKFDSYKQMVDHISAVAQLISYLRNRGHA